VKRDHLDTKLHTYLIYEADDIRAVEKMMLSYLLVSAFWVCFFFSRLLAFLGHMHFHIPFTIHYPLSQPLPCLEKKKKKDAAVWIGIVLTLSINLRRLESLQYFIFWSINISLQSFRSALISIGCCCQVRLGCLLLKNQ